MVPDVVKLEPEKFRLTEQYITVIYPSISKCWILLRAIAVI